MVGVFPLVNYMVTRRNENVSTIRRDLWVSKIISVAAVVGCFLIAFSLTLPQFIICKPASITGRRPRPMLRRHC